MQNGGMIASADLAADFFESDAGHRVAQIHCDLAWNDNFVVSFVAANVVYTDVEVFGYRIDDQCRCYFLFFIRRDNIF